MIEKLVVVTILAFMLSACVRHSDKIEARDGYFASHAFTAVGQNERIRFLVLHYTAVDDVSSLNILTKEQVSAHYLIPKEPKSIHGQPVVLQLVDENKRAWHAGISSWNGRSGLNDTSIGIEIVNLGYTDNMLGQRTWYPYTEKQIAAVAALAKDIVNRYHIEPDNVVGHSDIAPLRKQDPGKLFPWEHLAAMGIGAWPDRSTVNKYLADRSPHSPVKVSVIQALLKQYGYDQIPQNGVLDENTRKTVSAFQMHFRPSDISGNADAETEAIARALLEKYRGISF
ncbi:N-acetylmuramoyl-L-alanine amidase [Edwardsiella ictaluri]|nr:N-acetylmuramoyl-L-alanine amidase [Edwardsiella ictaluri]EKS7764589.1 N-acetylmuramoyl-L-alanine amidase [Edwardsiella ictaluri]EKS7771665.1 N-acetylmuramoyl-L-alanine amidase [Edwardsiella ictaluri]EKS7774845.1 N-acetylmuramoyl-L-alanine amidase [Edwardsiella ictaluri]EKS7777908.1 N-acetylmuramoyl-L-alanine amidase [Edwardsiella ictaluri]